MPTLGFAPPFAAIAAHIETGLELAHPTGDPFELRALDVPTTDRASGEDRAITWTGVFSTPETARKALLSREQPVWRAFGLYEVMNPPIPARAPVLDRFTPRGRALRDEDIARRDWILVDLDPTAPDALNRQAALQAAWDLSTLLGGSPLVYSTGRGAALRFRVNLPTTSETTVLVRRVLHAIECLVEQLGYGDLIVVDEGVFNAARLHGVAGTLNRKIRPTMRELLSFNPPEIVSHDWLAHVILMGDAAARDLDRPLAAQAVAAFDERAARKPDRTSEPSEDRWLANLASIRRQCATTATLLGSWRSHSHVEWLAVANLLVFCEDGERLFVEGSSRYRGSSESRSRAVFRYAARRVHGAPRCAHLRALPRSACRGCPHEVNSPVALSRSRVAPPWSGDDPSTWEPGLRDRDLGLAPLATITIGDRARPRGVGESCNVARKEETGPEGPVYLLVGQSVWSVPARHVLPSVTATAFQESTCSLNQNCSLQVNMSRTRPLNPPSPPSTPT